MSDATADRIRAYLDSVEPRDCAADSKEYRRSLSLVERLAASAEGERRPTLRLSTDQCADVLRFIAMSDPTSFADRFNDNGKTSYLVGLNMVMYAVEDSVRGQELAT